MRLIERCCHLSSPPSHGHLWHEGEESLIYDWKKVLRHCGWVLTRKEHFTDAHSVGGSGFPDFCLGPRQFPDESVPNVLFFTGELAPSGGECEVQHYSPLGSPYLNPAVTTTGMLGDLCLNFESNLFPSICTLILKFQFSGHGVPCLVSINLQLENFNHSTLTVVLKF